VADIGGGTPVVLIGVANNNDSGSFSGKMLVYDKDGNTGPVFEGKDAYTQSGAHEGNFLECIKSRNTPHADVEIGRLSTTICHLGNICTHLRRDRRGLR
jgi:hypothetical protein